MCGGLVNDFNSRRTGTHATPGPIYGRVPDMRCFWLPLLEKGYAKLNRTYEVTFFFLVVFFFLPIKAIAGGTLGESMSALTGAVSISLFLPHEADW